MSDTNASPSLDDKPLETSAARRPLPVGAVVKLDPNTWYYCKVNYIDDKGNSKVGYLSAVGGNATISFWDYICVNDDPGYKFRPNLGSDGWEQWECQDGNYLSLKATGWYYRSSAYPLWFKIVDGKLYNSYWDGPAGSVERRILVSDARYVGQGFPELAGCEFIAA